MRYSLVTIAAGFAVLSFAEAVPAPHNGHMRYYFPREVKRQVQPLDADRNRTGTSTTSSSPNLLDQLSAALNSGSGSTTGSGSAETTPTGGIQIGQNTVITTTGSDSSDPSTTPPADQGTPTTTPGNIIDSLLNPTTTPVATPTSDPSTTAGGIQITPPATPTDGITRPTTAPTTIDTGLVITPLPTTPIVTPTDTNIVKPPPLTTTPTADPNTNPTPSPTDNTTPSGITGPVTKPTSTPTDPITTPTAPITTPPPEPVPSTPSTPTGSTQDTAAGKQTTPTDVNTTPITPPSSDASLVATTTPGTPPQSIAPTATNSQTALSQESSIVSASSVPPTSGAPTSTPSTIPSSLPRIIMSPNGQVESTPTDGSYQLIQLGFTYGLNYPFVVSNQWAVQQIFDFLPPGIAGGIDKGESDVVMQYLQPLNTLSRTGYITTLAMAKIPVDSVNTLSLALLNPKSDLYNNKNPTVRTLVNMLDPTIPLLAGQSLSDGNPINSANSASTTGKGNGGGAAGNDDSSTSKVNPTSIGIGFGVVGGAAVYGVAMFMVARRYKKRKNAHKRASSVQSGSSNGSGARETNTLMTGARNSYGSRPQPMGYGRDSRTSDRSQQSGRTYISPPVMAENSLGWN